MGTAVQATQIATLETNNANREKDIAAAVNRIASLENSLTALTSMQSTDSTYLSSICTTVRLSIIIRKNKCESVFIHVCK